MAKEWAKAFYNSKRWTRCRDSYIAERMKIDGGMCDSCIHRSYCMVAYKKYHWCGNHRKK